MRIDLGLESRKYDNAVMEDSLDAYAGIVAAVEGLTLESHRLDMLEKAAAGIEKASAMVTAVSDASGDNDLATAVGRETLVTSLSLIGQANMIDDFTVGKESVTYGAEGSNLLETAWKKAKEVSAKIWAWIKELLTKTINFIKSLFGKKEDTYETLIKLLDDAKEDGRTTLTIKDFGEAVQDRLAKETPVTLKMLDGKDLTDSAISDSITAMLTAISDKDAGKKVLSINKADTVANITKLLDSVTDTIQIGKDYKLPEDIVDASKISDIFDNLFYTKDSLFGQLFNGNAVAFKGFVVDGDDTISGDVRDYVENELSGYDSVKVSITAVTPRKIQYIAACVKDDGLEEKLTQLTALKTAKKFTSDIKDLSAVRTLVKGILSAVSIKEGSYTVPEKDVKEFGKNVKPLEYTDAKSIAEKLKGVNKNIDKTLIGYSKVVDKFEKDLATVEKKIEKKLFDKNLNDDARKVGEIVNSINDFSRKAITTVAKANITANTLLAAELARCRFSHVIKESIKNYVKK